ncbi:MAG: TIGR04086 family membrane protein [Clostridia bacterium]|nr:TIGR04086 family membrane protein [Clostridia bacterium]
MSNCKSTILSFIKGTVIAVIFSLVAILIFAFLIKAFSISLGAIKPVVIILKILAVFLGVLFSINGEKGLIKGGALGIIIIFITFILFSIIGKSFGFSINFLWELLLGLAVGGVGGILGVNLKK